jgi:Protein of unknown function (DUF1097)
MPLLTALAISIGVLGGIATYLFVGPAGGLGLQIWAAFIAWACFYHTGGKEGGLMTTIACNILGVIIGWLALIGVTQLAGSLGVPLAAGICVAIGAAAIVLFANIPTFSAIPATVYGFGCVAGFTLLAHGKLDTLYSGAINDNPLMNIVASMVIGAAFGYVSEKVGGMLAASPSTVRA